MIDHLNDRLADLEYDALGRRVKKVDWSLFTTGDPVRYYLSSGQNEVAEYNGQGQRVRYYVHGPTYIDERVVMHNDPAGGGASTTGSDYIYLLKDLYTVAGLADERGWPVERYDYDAYGKVYMNRCAVLPWAADFDGDGDVDQNDLTVFLDSYGGSGQASNGPRGWWADLDGDGDVNGSDCLLFADAYDGAGNPPRPPSPTVSVGSMAITSGSMVVSRVGNPFFFTGRRLDVMDKQDAGTPHHFTDDYAGLQLYDYRARTMDPVLGRFVQRDPLGTIHGAWFTTTAKHAFRGVLDHPVIQYLPASNLLEYVAGSPDTHLDPTGLIFNDVNGKPCDIKVCRRQNEIGHTWIEFDDGSVHHFPWLLPSTGYPTPTHHNWLTTCDAVYPNPWNPTADCKTCDEIKNCIRDEMIRINIDWVFSYWWHNCIAAKNQALRSCGLVHGLYGLGDSPNPPPSRPPIDIWRPIPPGDIPIPYP